MNNSVCEIDRMNLLLVESCIRCYFQVPSSIAHDGYFVCHYIHVEPVQMHL